MIRRSFWAGAVAVAVLLVLAGTVLASPSNAVSMTLVRSGVDSSEIGWSATGAIVDSGGWTTENRIIGGSDHSNAFVVTQVLTTEVGAKGTFRLRFQGRENHQISFSGNWELYGGSGAYAGVTGTGHWYATVDQVTGNRWFVLTGYVR
jgi:hypothetical protein